MKQYPYVSIIVEDLNEEAYSLVLKQLKFKVFYGINRGYFLWGRESLHDNNLKVRQILNILDRYSIRTRTASGATTTQYIHFGSLTPKDKHSLAADIRNAVVSKYKEVNND